ncbi:hypothetical protein [Halomicrococcus sp. SG-WS-1]|uniref:hypothetical protein n=1 Tax=Halomicrococcus sp. SG-WS-1 TaxID=3439057 RepID=UPI003F795C59
MSSTKRGGTGETDGIADEQELYGDPQHERADDSSKAGRYGEPQHEVEEYDSPTEWKFVAGPGDGSRRCERPMTITRLAKSD